MQNKSDLLDTDLLPIRTAEGIAGQFRICTSWCPSVPAARESTKKAPHS